jgi:hypothetical protein
MNSPAAGLDDASGRREDSVMVSDTRMPLFIQMSGRIIERAFSTGKLEYGISPSTAIEVGNIQSLRAARYCVEFGAQSEWMDIEELTVLIEMILKTKWELERRASQWVGRNKDIETNMRVSPTPSEEQILATASKIAFSAPKPIP